jgi:hypothetical protein
MDVPKPEDLSERSDNDKELSRDSELSPTFSCHGENCSWMLNAGLCEIADAFIEPAGQNSEFRMDHCQSGCKAQRGA